ncbi:MAG: ATP-binding protein [Flectobacillus sp.]|uniref:tetratricopeptide repeat-containing sensor histidine kinase n=1 Tax=Flectobacillus sp. TaxID=50419 RepID=UPI003B99F304
MKSICSLLVWTCVFFRITNLLAQTFPHPDSLYTKAQLERFIQDFQVKNNIRGLAMTYLVQAKNQERWNLSDESPIDSYRKSMDYFRVLGDSLNYYEVKGSLGAYFMDRPLFANYAKEYLTKAVQYFRKIHRPDLEIGHMINLANLAIRQNQMSLAKEYLLRSDELPKSMLSTGRIEAAWADWYRGEGYFTEAIAKAQHSLKIAKTLKVAWLEAVSYFYLGSVFRQQENYKLAIESLKLAQKITERYFSMLLLRKAIYEELGLVYKKQRLFESAFDYTFLAYKAQQLVESSKLEVEVRQYREYQLLEEQQEKISKIALEKRLAIAELDSLKATQRIYILTILMAFLLLILMLYAYFSKQKLARLQADKVFKTAQIDSLQALINGQEQERLRISQDLHDGLGTLLSRIKMMMDAPLWNNIQLQQMLDDACTEVRNISGNLQPSNLQNFGLIAAIEDLVSKNYLGKTEIIFQVYGEYFDIGKEKSLMIYRIVQELLANALKYAEASEVIIQISFQKKHIHLTVEDNGKGFDTNIAEHSMRGWRNIRSRLDYLQGTLSIESDSQFGTAINIEVESN